MPDEDNPLNSGTHFSEVWANAQVARNAFLTALVRNAWQQLFGNAAQCDQPIGNARRYLGGMT
jgi:hypothetical protein